MQNLNCMNVCLGNELLTEIDKYASELGVNRDYAIRKLIKMARYDSWQRKYMPPWAYPSPNSAQQTFQASTQQTYQAPYAAAYDATCSCKQCFEARKGHPF